MRSMLAYLRGMVGLAVRIGRAGFAHGGQMELTGIDQGIHNVLLWSGMGGPNVTILSNEQGPVFHSVCYEPQVRWPRRASQAHAHLVAP